MRLKRDANRFRDAGRRSVSVLAVAHGLVDRLDNMRWCLEVEVQRIADVQRKNLVALGSDFVGNARQVADCVADIVEPRGGGM